MTHYQTEILKIAPAYDPRHIEAFMRCELGTLDHLEERRFRHEVKTACACIDADRELAERLAKSYGL